MGQKVDREATRPIRASAFRPFHRNSTCVAWLLRQTQEFGTALTAKNMFARLYASSCCPSANPVVLEEGWSIGLTATSPVDLHRRKREWAMRRVRCTLYAGT